MLEQHAKQSLCQPCVRSATQGCMQGSFDGTATLTWHAPAQQSRAGTKWSAGAGPSPHGGSAPEGGAAAQVGPDLYWGYAGLVGTSSAGLGTQLDNNTVVAPFGGVAVIAFGQGMDLPPARFGRSAYVNVTGAFPAA